MVGLIENQQAIQQSTAVEKIHQAKQENLPVFQEYAAADLKDKQLRKQRQVNSSNQTEDVVINEKDGRKHKKKKNEKKKSKSDSDVQQNLEPSEHLLDIVV